MHDTTLMINMFTLFIKEQKKQISTVEASFNLIKASVDDIRNIESFNLSVYGATSDLAIRNLLNLPVYVYANYKTGGVGIPVRKMNVEQMEIGDISAKVLLDGQLFYNNIKHIESFNGSQVEFGKSFKMDLSTCKINFNLKGNLSERIEDLLFLKKLINNSNAKIKIENYIEAEIGFLDTEDKIKEIELIDMFLTQLKAALDYVGCKNELTWVDLNNTDERNMKLLIEGVMNNRSVSLTDFKNKRGWLKLEIGNLNIPVIFEQNNDGTYDFKSMFHDNNVICYMDKKGEKRTSLFLQLKKMDLCLISNLDYKKIQKKITSIPFYQEYGVSVNNFLLEAILAFDENQNQKLIDMVMNIYKWIYSQEQSDIYLLNWMQAIKRRSAYKQKEIKLLYSLKLNTSNTLIRFGANILLESFYEAQVDWTNLEEDVKAQLRKLPIYLFWKDFEQHNLGNSY